MKTFNKYPVKKEYRFETYDSDKNYVDTYFYQASHVSIVKSFANNVISKSLRNESGHTRIKLYKYL